MKAVVIEEFGGPEKLQLKDVPKPVPTDQEVLIRLAYAGVNPVDWKTREGLLQRRMPHHFPLILGWDAAGVIVEKGKGVHGLKNGDEVFAYVRRDFAKWGSYAEFITFDAHNVAKKPHNLTLAQAATVPLVSLTAWQSIFDTAHLKENETLLVLGGSGGVGSMAIQFAKYAGARVLATASKKKHDYVKNFGADYLFDYSENFVAQIKKIFPEGVDVVFDTVGGETFEQGLSCLKKHGRIVSILEQLDPAEAKKRHITASHVFVCANGKQLREIAFLIEHHKVKPLPILEMPLKDAAIAQEMLRSGKVLGKIVLKI